MRAIGARAFPSSFVLLLGLGPAIAGVAGSAGVASASAVASASEIRQPAVFHSGPAGPAGRVASLELASGERITPPLPAGAELANAAALGEHGWVVTAVRAQEIVVLTGDITSAATLPAPPVASRLRREPLPLVEDGHLGGLVWLEGDSPRTLAVRYARFNGIGWEAPRTIAAPGPGSQLALAAARLADNTWLLAWSAFDGHDDEIVWSRQAADGTWSAPRRVAADNDVPDITPALTATADGALLAWSRFDGNGYRVVTAHFHAGRWEKPVAAASSGSFFPAFQATGSTARWLLYQTAAPQGWAALEVDGTGKTGRSARVATASGVANGETPVVEAAPDHAGVSFRWPATGEERAASWVRP
jgi:hypothetical protein